MKLPGQVNYFVGTDRQNWRSGVETFARVRYESVLPGVDVEYYGTEGRELEYDLFLAAGVTPDSLALDFGGVSRITLSADGRAQLRLLDGSLVVKEPPVAYQVRSGKRVLVAVKYVLRGPGLGFAVGEHDVSLPLVIDPVLTYSSYFGGSSFDEATAIAADSAGNTYFVGYTASSLFPTWSPVQPVHGGGAYDAFVVKLDPSGQHMVYSTYLGGSGPDIAYAVATDALGNAYVAGLTSSPNFPVSAAFQPALGGGQDAFVTKLNASGSALIYSTYLGGLGDDFAQGITVSGAGAAYLVGTTFSPNFPTKAPLQASIKGGQDAFVTQLNPSGAALVYSTFLGGGDTEYGSAIALDSSGSAYVVGSTTSPNYPTLNARQTTFAGGGTDAFLSKLNLTGSGLVFSTYLGGTSADEALGVSAPQGFAVVAGFTFSTDFPVTLPAQPVAGGNNNSDAFVTRFDASGTAAIYSTYFGGTGNDRATAVVSDSGGIAYVVGRTDSADLPLVAPSTGQGTYGGAVDAFALALPASGSRFAYATYLGGAGEDRAAGVALSPGTTHVVGITRSLNFPLVNPIINGSVGAQDAFVVKLPSIDTVTAAPAGGLAWLAFAAALLLALALVLLSARRAVGYRTER